MLYRFFDVGNLGSRSHVPTEREREREIDMRNVLAVVGNLFIYCSMGYGYVKSDFPRVSENIQLNKPR